ncbi:MAG: ribose-phosphate diphosphokinase, partial [Acidobacteria bacterium]|nr:ribose-phosphate diphosphokinase [Acidobacteriota bacterium]
PYFGYARQDRKDKPRVPISSKLVADLITVAGAGRVLAMDLHAGQIQGFFNIPFDHLFAAPIFVEYFRKTNAPTDLVVVSPDAGGVERARAYAKRLKADLALCDKRRDKSHAGHSDAEVMNIVGEVAGHPVLVVDDMIDTAGSLYKVAQALKQNGAREVRAACTHAVLSGPALERIDSSAIEEVVVTDTIPLHTDKPPEKLRILPVAPLLAEAIQSIHEETSVSSLFI